MEQRNQVLRADVSSGRFLSDLRALRTQAGLDHGQLAARAHFPRHVIAAAEAGPYLPALPVLAAYVRGCGGTGDEILAWEDRWRLATGSEAHPLLSTRVAGLSASNQTVSPKNSDPVAIRTALQRFGNRMSQPGPEPSPDGPRETVLSPVAPAASAAPATPVDPGTPVPPAAPAADGAAGPAGPASPGRVRRMPSPQQNTATGPGRRGGRSGRTIAIAAIVAALLILLIVVLAL